METENILPASPFLQCHMAYLLLLRNRPKIVQFGFDRELE